MTEITKDEITELMLSEMLENDLADIQFWWDKNKSYRGRTHYTYINGDPVVIGISLSASFFDGLIDKWDMVDTLYHELAHAIAIRDFLAFGLGHSKKWKNIAEQLGANPVKCGNKPVSRKDMNYKYTAFCIDCAYQHYFSRMGKNWKANYYVCPYCDKDLEIQKNY